MKIAGLDLLVPPPLQMYQEFNDFLFNILCSPELEFQDDNLPPEKPGYKSSRV